MSAPSPTSPEQVGLRHARQPLQRILTRSGIDDAEASAHRGARAMAPALAALALAREIVDPWDGLIHRRCRIAPAPHSSAHPRPPRLRRTARSGWELIEVTVELSAEVAADGAPSTPPPQAWPVLQIRHDLARRPLPAPEGADPLSTASAVGAAPTDATRPAHGSHGSHNAASGRRLILTGDDLAAWASATGDDNPIHLVLGAARRAGLAAEEDGVVAHGLLLAALSLGLVPADPRHEGLDLLFPAALAVGRPGAALIVDERGSCWSAVGKLRVLRRQGASTR